MSLSPQLLLPAEYVRDAAKRIRAAKTRVSFLTLVVADDDTTDDLIDALTEAAERGVTVEVAADVFTYGELGGFFLPTRYRSRQSRTTTKLAKRFTKSGIKFTWLGRFSVMFSGRTHIKWCVVDDIVYSFGGVNLYQKGINNVDFMFKETNKLLADKLIAEYHHLLYADSKASAYRSSSFKVGNDTVLIDGGFFGDSIIYRRAVRLAREASRITFVSQYGPTGKLSKILHQKDSRLYFNSPSSIKGLNKLVIQAGILFTGHQTRYMRPKYLHAKFMIFDMPDGRRIALTGSHNFVNGGVLLGTREIALQTENPQTITQLEDFLRDYIA